MKTGLKVGLVLAVAAVALIPVSSSWRESQLIRQSERLQASLEEYRTTHGEYPESLVAFGISDKEEGPIYYHRKSMDSYELWFGAPLGESRVFSSKDRK